MGKRLSFTYDAADRRTVMKDPDGGRTTYAYDGNNCVTVLTNPQGERTSYSYDVANRRARKFLANGTRASISYTGSNALNTVYHLKSNGSLISGFAYQTDGLANRTRVTEASGDIVTWTYDTIYPTKLRGEMRSGANAYRTTYTYDNAHNHATKRELTGRTTYAYDVGNRMRRYQDSGGYTTFTYDADGNTRSIRQPSGDITTNTWDYENRNTQVELPTGAIHTYIYDFAGNRVAAIDDLGVATSFLYDAKNVLLETDSAGLTQVSYTIEPSDFTPFGVVAHADRINLSNAAALDGMGRGIGPPGASPGYGNYVSQRRDGATSFYHFDGIGSTRELTDSSQVVTDESAFKAYGETAAETGATPHALQWVGEQGVYKDEATDRYEMGIRIYSALFARFFSQDPPPPKGSDDPNRYLYVGNNPVNLTDPSGLQVCCECTLYRQASGEEIQYTVAPTDQECYDVCQMQYGRQFGVDLLSARCCLAAGQPQPEPPVVAPRPPGVKCMRSFSVDIVVKSFINGLDDIGGFPFDLSATARLYAFADMVKDIDAFNQHPITLSKEAEDYRLYTRAVVKFCCLEDVYFNPEIVLTDKAGGYEKAGFSGTIEMSDVRLTHVSVSRVRVSWGGWGHPHDVFEYAMRHVLPRTSKNIWHTPAVDLFCAGSIGYHQIHSFRGSKFPSRQLWINSAWKPAREIGQGAFSDLWYPQPGQPAFVSE